MKYNKHLKPGEKFILFSFNLNNTFLDTIFTILEYIKYVLLTPCMAKCKIYTYTSLFNNYFLTNGYIISGIS